jgi:hypothetical protein
MAQEVLKNGMYLIKAGVNARDMFPKNVTPIEHNFHLKSAFPGG